METYVGHDLKNQKGEISGGLPPGLKIIPVLFYACAVFCSGAIGWFEFEKRQAAEEAERWRSEMTAYQAEAARVAKERSRIEALNTRAGEVSKWVEGALNLQPVCVAISRAAGQDAAISELTLSRNAELPAQVHLTLKMSHADSRVMDATLEGLRDLSFRAYSAQQKKELDQIDYRATLVWQQSAMSNRQEEGEK